MPADSGAPLTPDRRVRVFVSSTLQELAAERHAARDAVTRLRLTPVMFELGARPHPPRELYRAYLAQSDVFVGIYWRRYGWVAPGETVSGLEDEYLLSGDRPKLIYVRSAEQREPRLEELLARIQDDDRAAYKPFDAAEELGELVADDLAVLLTERFTAVPPAVASPGLRTARLPVPPTGLVGRAAEVAAMSGLLEGGGVRLLTLVGPGGIGKTRLALEVARSFHAEGAWFVDLAPVADPGQVPGAIAAALGVRPEGSGPVLDLLADRLHDRAVLLVLDNFEQVLPAAADLAALLAACPAVRMLVTSRTALRVRGEHEVPLAPLPEVEAVRLLVERGRDVRAGFEPDADTTAALAELARRLDGIPLALELAAARLRLLSPAQLLHRLGDRLDRPLDLAAGPVDLPDRQRTLRSTIEWSYGLLSPAERALLDRLSVFTGAFTLAGAEAVGTLEGDPDVLDTLSSLVAQSMVAPAEEHDGRGDPRFRMLGTVRAYARERLVERGERAATLARLTGFLREFAGAAGPHLAGPDNRAWAARVDGELDDLRSMMSWAAAHDDAETVVRLAAPLFPYWWSRGLLAPMRELADQAAALPSAAGLAPDARALLLWARGMLRIAVGDTAGAQPYLGELREAAEVLGDRRLRAHALAGLGLAELTRGADPAAAAELLDEAVATFGRLGDDWGLAFALSARGQLALVGGDPAAAARMHADALAAAVRIDSDHLRAQLVDLLGMDAAAAGDLAGAWSRFADASRVHAELLDQEGSAYCLDGFAGLALAAGRPELAARLQGAAAHARQVVGVAVWPGMRPLADVLSAAVDAALGQPAAAAARTAGAACRIPEALDWARDATRPADPDTAEPGRDP